MSDTSLTAIAAAAAASFVAVGLLVARGRPGDPRGRVAPAALGACFAAWSVYAERSAGRREPGDEVRA